MNKGVRASVIIVSIGIEATRMQTVTACEVVSANALSNQSAVVFYTF
ncbi:Hypothetical protein LOCK919_0274 [Lacticaseibacillus paracasei]|nr:Hypothetical protein LOCK919_0274 [Lacticaseibacillus paracasei]EPC23999.1 hypothetical protein Lpp46_2751 [Lacticaseibacillus paracasei subsp. paracasei Lpp46]EPC27772.1 hypothetical protein Lpp17_0447 [Lacticaseibacillus paracasei subsp. paracasei Lpp17]